MIVVQDGYGRELRIPRSEWTLKVLPATIEKQWNNPDELYAVVVAAVRDGFAAHVTDASEHLYETDTDHTRSTALYCVILRQLGRLDDAETVTREFLAKHGEDSLILTNLAVLQQAKGNQDDAEKTLWRALELDPNFSDSFGLYWKTFDDRGGRPASDEATRRVAALPGSWRAQLWLARNAIAQSDFEEAEKLHREALANAGDPSPTGLLMEISGDLGKAGRGQKAIELVEPRFNAGYHGINVGNNLIKAHVDLGEFEEAHRILDQLYALKRPDWNQTLSYWDTEIAKGRVATKHIDAPLQFRMIPFEVPIWLSSQAAELLRHSTKPGPRIAFIGSTADKEDRGIVHMLADAPGRLSRSIPLFLAEQIFLQSSSGTTTLQPYVFADSPGFLYGGNPFEDKDGSDFATRAPTPCEFVVLTHLLLSDGLWKVRTRLVRCTDAALLGTVETEFDYRAPGDALVELASNLLQLLAKQSELEIRPAEDFYEVPKGTDSANYLLRLEQLLTLRCAALSPGGPGSLHGEREILDGNLRFCLEYPKNATARLLLAQSFLAMKSVKPEAVQEFRDKVTALQIDFPLFAVAQIAVQEILGEALG